MAEKDVIADPEPGGLMSPEPPQGNQWHTYSPPGGPVEPLAEHPVTDPLPATPTPAKGDRPPTAKPAAPIGSRTFDDGYKMERSADGTDRLTGGGQTATWDKGSGSWVDASGKPMPSGWDQGHAPGTPDGGRTN